MLLRPALGILNFSYSFVYEHLGKKKWSVIPAGPKMEMRQLRGSMHLAQVELWPERSGLIYIGDSSLVGYDATVGNHTGADVLDMWRWRENWRFAKVPKDLTRISRGWSPDGHGWVASTGPAVFLCQEHLCNGQLTAAVCDPWMGVRWRAPNDFPALWSRTRSTPMRIWWDLCRCFPPVSLREADGRVW